MALPVSAICTNHGERLVDVGLAMWNFQPPPHSCTSVAGTR